MAKGVDKVKLLEEIKTDFDERLARLAADPAQWVTFIEQVVLFGARYSVGNQMALMMQCAQRGIEPQFFLPFGNKDGTSGWKKYGRSVRKGEKAFYVTAPITRRPTPEQAAEREAAGWTVRRDPDGRPSIQIVGFDLSATYDLSQTDGAPFEVPTVERVRRQKLAGGKEAVLLVGDDPTGVFDDTVKLIKDEGYGYELVPPGTGYLRGANGVTVRGTGIQVVQVRDDVSGAQRIKTTMHELAHIRCEHLDGTRLEDLHRGRRETEAESVAHIACKALGLDSEAYSDAYVLGWANGDMNLVRACAETVMRVAKKIMADLTPALAEPCDAAAGQA